MREVITNASKIIENASQSPLGIAALIILALSVISFLFFKDAHIIIRISIFFIITGAFFALYLTSIRVYNKKNSSFEKEKASSTGKLIQ